MVKIFKQFKRMNLGFSEPNLDRYYLPKNKMSKIITGFQGLIMAVVCVSLGLSTAIPSNDIKSIEEVDFTGSEFRFAANKKWSYEYWLLKYCDLEKVGEVITPDSGEKTE